MFGGSARTRNGRLALLALAPLVLFGGGPAEAGFFDFLFGRRDPAPIYMPSQTPRFQTQRPRKKKVHALRDGESPGMSEAARNLASSRKFAELARERGYRGAFVDDHTLRYGDIVVTRIGLEVFEGRKSAVHAMQDFKPLALSSLKARSDLVKLQRSAIGGAEAPAPEPEGGAPLTIRKAATGQAARTAEAAEPATRRR